MMFRVFKAQSGARPAGRHEGFIFGGLEWWGRKACLGLVMGLSPKSEGSAAVWVGLGDVGEREGRSVRLLGVS